MPLKKRTMPAAGTSAGAGVLPSLMANLPGTRMLENLPVESLTPAPDEWNFYAPLPDGKFIELLDSIQTNGLLHPIVVWKQPNGRCMILSGHNRARAFRALLEKTGAEKYRTIPATVLTDITADEAHEIVVDSNFVQRILTPSEKAHSIYQKYVLAGRKKRSRNGERRSKYDIIAEQYDLSSRQIARYVRLALLPDCLQKLMDAGKLPLNTALRLVDFPPETQQYLAEKWPDSLRSRRMDELKKEMDFKEIDAILSGKKDTVRVSFSVPASLAGDFCTMAAAWLEEKSRSSD